jgi:hypothetical protein
LNYAGRNSKHLRVYAQPAVVSLNPALLLPLLLPALQQQLLLLFSGNCILKAINSAESFSLAQATPCCCCCTCSSSNQPLQPKALPAP